MYYSSYGDDGNKNTVGGYCAITDPEPAPWWAVDLGEPFDVYGATLTNRGDGWRKKQYRQQLLSLLVS